jgi:fumarate reductase flavoprotein subunit
MTAVSFDPVVQWDARVPLLIVGAGAAGMCAETLKRDGAADRFGRQFAPEERLRPLFYAVKVTGALFHTQGGLAIDAIGRVKRKNGTLFPNLFAAGGAAAGISGTSAKGYLSGNGLLTATVLGRSIGQAAAALVLHASTEQ